MDRLVVDTNVLMEYADVLKTIEGKLIIPSFVVEELDNLKTKAGDVGSKARGANRLLREIEDRVELNTLEIVTGLIPEGLDPNKMDNKILAIAKLCGAGVISGDFGMIHKAKKIFNIPAIDIFKMESLYTGVREVLIGDEDVELKELFNKHLENPDGNLFDLEINQYLIIYNKSTKRINDRGEVEYDKVDKIKRWDGENMRRLKIAPQSVVEPWNDYQACAIDLMYNEEIPIKILAGTYGSGKTMIGLKTAIDQVKEGKYGLLLGVRNPVGKGEQVGFLPGTKEDKVGDFFKPLNQYIDMYERQRMEGLGQLASEIPFYMKGLSYDDTFILVDEAEDMDVDILKLIGTRIGRGSVICFAGDYKQAEGKFKHFNGLVSLINDTKSNPLVGVVVLPEDVRSDASKVFANLGV